MRRRFAICLCVLLCALPLSTARAIGDFTDADVGAPTRADSSVPDMVPGSPDQVANELRARMTSGTVPALSVPIPGVTFTSTTVRDGKIEVPFLAQYVSGLYRYALGIVTLVAIIMVVYGGFLYLLGASTGDVKKGQTYIRDALMGSGILFLAYIILYAVNPKTVRFEPLRIDAVQTIGLLSTDDPTVSDADPDEATAAGGAAGSCNDHTIVTVRGPNGQSLQVPRWKSHLKPMVYGDHVAWCADCPGVSCGFSRSQPDPTCAAIAGHAGDPSACGGQFGLFLRALSGGNCQGKSFDYLDGLDGFTYGIRNAVVWNMPGLMQSFANADRAAFERIFARANLAQWYHDGDVTDRAWFCREHETLKGLACDAGLRSALQEASHEPAFVRVQLEDVWNKYQQRVEAARPFFPTTAAGPIAWAVLGNNPGGDQCRIGSLMGACASGTEAEKYDCMLRTFVERECRGGRASAQRRVETIRRVLRQLPENARLETQSLEDITTRCRA